MPSRSLFSASALAALGLAAAGCSSNLYFGTSTTVGLGVQGTGKIPTKVAFAHDRTETAIVPQDANGKTHSTFASLDSEWTWTQGFIIKQQFATGKAADVAAQSDRANLDLTLPNSQTGEKPLLFLTSAKLGFALDFGETVESPASILVGYRRYEATLMPDVRGKPALDPVYADISIISDAQGLPPEAFGPRLGGVRIKQRFATGLAALHAVADGETRAELRKAVLPDPAVKAMDDLANRYGRMARIQAGYRALSASQQTGYLAALNDIFGRAATPLTAANLQAELRNLTDRQLDVAIETLKKQ